LRICGEYEVVNGATVRMTAKATTLPELESVEARLRSRLVACSCGGTLRT
jgi:hypothetical protein